MVPRRAISDFFAVRLAAHVRRSGDSLLYGLFSGFSRGLFSPDVDYCRTVSRLPKTDDFGDPAAVFHHADFLVARKSVAKTHLDTQTQPAHLYRDGLSGQPFAQRSVADALAAGSLFLDLHGLFVRAGVFRTHAVSQVFYGSVITKLCTSVTKDAKFDINFCCHCAWQYSVGTTTLCYYYF